LSFLGVISVTSVISVISVISVVDVETETLLGHLVIWSFDYLVIDWIIGTVNQ